MVTRGIQQTNRNLTNTVEQLMELPCDQDFAEKILLRTKLNLCRMKLQLNEELIKQGVTARKIDNSKMLKAKEAQADVMAILKELFAVISAKLPSDVENNSSTGEARYKDVSDCKGKEVTGSQSTAGDKTVDFIPLDNSRTDRVLSHGELKKFVADIERDMGALLNTGEVKCQINSELEDGEIPEEDQQISSPKDEDRISHFTGSDGSGITGSDGSGTVNVANPNTSQPVSMGSVGIIVRESMAQPAQAFAQDVHFQPQLSQMINLGPPHYFGQPPPPVIYAEHPPPPVWCPNQPPPPGCETERYPHPPPPRMHPDPYAIAGPFAGPQQLPFRPPISCFAMPFPPQYSHQFMGPDFPPSQPQQSFHPGFQPPIDPNFAPRPSNVRSTRYLKEIDLGPEQNHAYSEQQNDTAAGYEQIPHTGACDRDTCRDTLSESTPDKDQTVLLPEDTTPNPSVDCETKLETNPHGNDPGNNTPSRFFRDVDMRETQGHGSFVEPFPFMNAEDSEITALGERRSPTHDVRVVEFRLDSDERPPTRHCPNVYDRFYRDIST